MRWLALFFIIQKILLFAGSSHTDNPPEAYVGGIINVITGELFLAEEDLAIRGAIPLSISRTYTGIFGRSEWRFFKHHKAYFYPNSDAIHIFESHGGFYTYQKAKGKKDYFELRDPPVTNASSGKMAGRTNLKNQHVLVKSKGKYLIVVTPSRAERIYRRFDRKDKGKTTERHSYLLDEEILPSGHRIRYFRDEENRLTKIESYDPSGSRLFASAEIKNHGKVKKGSLCPYETNHNFEVKGSDQREVRYNFFSKGEGETAVWHLEGVNSSTKPPVNYHYFKPKRQNDKRHKRQISKIIYPDSRFLQIDYFGHKREPAIRNRVKKLIAPVGQGGAAHTTHTFEYDLNNRTTTVREIEGPVTRYKWDTKERLVAIERSFADGRLATITRFIWGRGGDETGNLIARVYLNGHGELHSLYRYFYDARGNIIEERFYGNLSGAAPTIHLNENSLPSTEDAEYRSQKMRYSQDGKNLLIRLEEGKLITTYAYLPGTDLLTEERVCDEKGLIKRRALTYDANHLLIREEVHDGPAILIKEYQRRAKQPFYGIVEVQVEKYRVAGEEHLLQKRHFNYSPHGQLSEERLFDNQGNEVYTLHYKYDEKGRLIEESNPYGETIQRTYDKVGNCLTYKEIGHYKPKYMCYDAANRLKLLHDNDRETRHIYDLRGNEIQTIDPYSYTTHYRFDSLDRLIATEKPPLGGRASTTRYVYDDFDRLIEEQDPCGNTTKKRYNSYDQPTKIIYPDGSEESFFYNREGLLALSIDQEGTPTHFTYDAQKNLISKKRGEAEERYIYEGSYLVTYRDPEGHKTSYFYDAAGRKIAEEKNGERVEYRYDSLGRLACEKRGELLTLTEYDLEDRPITLMQKGVDGTLYSEEHIRYDARGNRIAHCYPHGEEHFEYDYFDRLIKKIDPLGAKTLIEYDEEENIVETIDPMGLRTIETYNGHYLIEQIDKATLHRTFCYNPAGKLISEVTEIPERTVTKLWRYDVLGRCASFTEAAFTPLERTTTYTYTPTGRLHSLQKPDGTTLYHDYDPYGNLIEQISSEGTIHYQFTYDLNGNLLTCDDIINETTHHRAYDPMGRLRCETLPNGLQITHRYDKQGRRTRLILPDNSPIDYEYDACHLISVVRPGYRHRYLKYDLSHNPVNQQLIGGRDFIKSTYDAKNRCVRLMGPSFLHKITQFDPAGNIIAASLNGQEFTYSYDKLYQLTEEKGHTYAYDALHNRLQKDTAHYTPNELSELPGIFDYDERGLPLAQKSAQYTFDALERLTQIKTPDATYTFTYDSLGRRLSKTTEKMGVLSTQYFFYDEQKEIGTTDEQGQITTLRVLGNTPRGELGAAVALELRGSIYIPIHDLYGNIAKLLSLNKTKAESYAYTAFGEEKVSPAPLSPWRYASKRTDETGLVYFGHRYYIPSLGRWLTPDPLGYDAGPNLYAYLSNSPLNRYDEQGLFDVDSFDEYVQNPNFYTPSFQYEPAMSFGMSMANGITNMGINSYNALLSYSPKLRVFSKFLLEMISHPRFQGSVQAFSGITEASAGGLVTLSTSGIATPIGWPIFAHGLDQLFTGIGMALTGEPRITLTEQILQATGVSPEWSSFGNNLLTIFGTMGGYAILQLSRTGASSYLYSPTQSTNVAVESNKIKSDTSEIIKLEDRISNWLGKETQFIRNNAGDPVFLSKDGSRCVRFDFNRTKPHHNPHAHVEMKVNGKWVKSGPIYPIDVPHN